MFSIILFILRHVETPLWAKVETNRKPRLLLSLGAGRLRPPLLVQLSRSGGTTGAAEGETSQTCPWIVVRQSSQQCSTSLPFPSVFIPKQLPLQSGPHLCIWLCLLPLPKGTLSLCFSTFASASKKLSKQVNETIYRKEQVRGERRGCVKDREGLQFHTFGRKLEEQVD